MICRLKLWNRQTDPVMKEKVKEGKKEGKERDIADYDYGRKEKLYRF